ncbi:hypothetical protein ACW9IK_09890 [Pseudomonas gingeri]|uniref:hypothetical protein n=1 Tax=Pseudomonas TaxID=286 RepID=UPI0015A2E970|nr:MULTISPECIES: hypothetical protein [Pseudomonas]NWE46057.1 hypothetical protein [Pseudomonas gingeri]BBP75311.1 hypothetical protein PHLH7_14150 [Pseudomonas sp. Ost2]
MKKLLSLALLLASTPTFATDASITKSAKPPSMFSYINTATSIHRTSFADFTHPINLTMKLKSIRWSTTLFPDAINERIQLCYFEPYSTTAIDCQAITPNSAGTTNKFNEKRFGHGVKVYLTHISDDLKNPAHPVGEDSITFEYSYQ